MPRPLTKTKMDQPSTGVITKLADLVLVRMVDGTLHVSGINGKQKRDPCIGLEGKDGLPVKRSTELVTCVSVECGGAEKL